MSPRAATAGAAPGIPFFVWACLGFTIPYLLFFVHPTFFNGGLMQVEPPLPRMDPIGVDLRAVMDMGRDWVAGGTPYQGLNLYPPLATLLFVALNTAGFAAAHQLMAFAAIGGTLAMTIGLPLHRERGRGVSPVLGLFVITGLLSYGLQFELERGQFNVLAVSLSVAGAWVFHAYPRYWLTAYALLSAGIQLKLYPAIFVLMLTRDWRDVRGTVRRIAALGLTNILLLFAMGPHLFADFLVAIDTLAFKFGGWNANHSIDSFVHFSADTLARQGLRLPPSLVTSVEWALLAVLLAALGSIIVMLRRDRQHGFDPYLLLACTVCGLLIPPISYDYKLALLAAPMALAMTEFERYRGAPGHPKTAATMIAVLMIAAYTSTLFSYTGKPTILDNNCPALFVILASVTALTQMRSMALRAELNAPVAIRAVG